VSRTRRRPLRVARISASAGLIALAATGCSRAEVEDKLRFGWPQGVTLQAEQMRQMWSWSSVAALAVGVVVWGLVFWTCVFHRRRKGDDGVPRQTALNLPLEIAYTIVPFLIVAVLFAYTAVIESNVNRISANPDTKVQVVGFKWNWQFVYLDKKDHAVTAEALSKGANGYVNTVGSSDEIPVLVLPVGKTILIDEYSPDVIHSFWVIDFLFKRDVIPGLDNKFEITVEKEGAYVGRCAELCGTYHSEMNFEVRAVSWDKYQAYMAELDRLGGTDPDRQRKALTAIGETDHAVTTYPFDTNRTARQASENKGS
jgi:cytochrome c oxidase subunit 2